MSDPITAGITAAVSGAAAIFSYNKDAFVFERTLRQTEAHQRQVMRVEEVALYREDIRDLFGVTVQKMDNYLIVNTLMLGFCISLLYAIELQGGTPDWIHWMWTLSMSGAMLFLLLSIWLCLHASITAQSLVVRLLTQWLRLPVPNSQEIAQYAARFQDYEKSANMLLRLPALGVAPRAPQVLPTVQENDEEDLSGQQLRKTHLHLFRELARSWRGYDAYARVCMIMGTNQLLQALGHLSIARMFLVNEDMFACLFVVITMHSLSLIHFKLNITPTRGQHTTMAFLLGAPPVTTFIAACCWYYHHMKAADIVAVFAIFIHLVWIGFVLTLAIEDEGGMPQNFTQVGLSADIVGDDTFQDFLDDELEKIHTRKSAFGQEEKKNFFSLPPQREEPVLELDQVKQRFGKLMRQWNNVAGGTLALTSVEEARRKRKIANRFEKLGQHVASLHLEEDLSALGEEIKALTDAKWNKVNSSVLINVETGEIRAPSTESGESKIAIFANQVRSFIDSDAVTSDNDDMQDEEEEETSVFLTTNSSTQETKSLIFGDSHETKLLLKKSSTRPWSSYKQGSSLLLICWMIALVMAILIACGYDWRNADYARGIARHKGHHSHEISSGIEAGVIASHLGAKMAAGAR